MAQSDKTVVSNALASNFPWTTESMAEDLGMELSSFRVWKNKVEKENKLAKAKVGSLLCIQDPESMKRLRYSDSYYDKIKLLRGSVSKRQSRKVQSAMGHSIYTIHVPIFDKTVADFLMKKFKDERGIETHLRDHLRNLASPMLSKMEELKQKFEREMESLMSMDL